MLPVPQREESYEFPYIGLAEIQQQPQPPPLPEVVTQAVADAAVVTGKSETISKSAEDVTGVAVEQPSEQPVEEEPEESDFIFNKIVDIIHSFNVNKLHHTKKF
jgi:hypothetical protein